MIKTKSTKRALLTSGLALLLCLSMFVGSTFAWFTDSVTSGVNKIVSGNLDVELYHMNFAQAAAASDWSVGFGIPKDETGEKVASDTKLFLNEKGEEMLWEPGATSVESFRIKNEGTLALKYQFRIDFYNATETPNGKTLADIINISADEIEYEDNGVPAGTTKLADRKLGDGYIFEGYLLPGEEYNFWVGLQWVPTDIDNEFNVEGGLSLDLGVTLLATQYTYEYDNFYYGNQYDKDATYMSQNEDGDWVIENLGQLAYFVQQVNGGNSYAGETIMLYEDIDLAGINWVSVGTEDVPFEGTFDGNGHTISNLSTDIAMFGYIDNGANVKNVNFENVAVTGKYAATVVNYAGKATIENVQILSGSVTGGSYGASIVFEADGVTIQDCVNYATVNAGYSASGIGAWIYNATVDGCTNYGEVVGGNRAGGICANFSGTMNDCTNNGDVTSNGTGAAGGIVGILGGNGTIENCTNNGDVTTTADNVNASAAGILGQTPNAKPAINNCTNTGNITAENSWAAGIGVSLYGGITATDCVNDGDVFGGDAADAIVAAKAPYGNGKNVANNCTNSGVIGKVVITPVDVPVAPLEEDFLFPAGTDAVLYKDMMLTGDAQIVHENNAVLGLSNVVADLDHDVIVRKSGGAICISDCNFTLTDGAKLISVGEGGDAYQVFLINVTVNGELLTNENAGQYLEGISWFGAYPEWPNT